MTSFQPAFDSGSSNPGPLFDFPPLSPTDFSSEGSDYGSSPFDFDPSPWPSNSPNPFGSGEFVSPLEEHPLINQGDSHCVVNVFEGSPLDMNNPPPPHEVVPDQIHQTTPSPISPPLPASPPPSSPVPISPLPTSPVSPSNNSSPVSPVSPVSPSSPTSPISPVPSPLPVSPVPAQMSTTPIPTTQTQELWNPYQQQQQYQQHYQQHQQPPHHQSPQSQPLPQQHQQQQPAPEHPPQKDNDQKERKRKRSGGGAVVPLEGSPLPKAILLTQDQLRTMSSEEYAAYVDQLKANHGLSASDKKEIQRQKRLIRNREYAQKKRRSVKEKTEHINQTVETQQTTITTLKDENSYLKSELHRLKSMLACILPPQQHHIIETQEPVLPLHTNPPTKKRRRFDNTSNSNPSHSSPVGQTVLFVFLLCFGVTLSTVFFLPDGVVSSSLRGAGRGLLSESSPLSYPLGKLKDVFWPMVEPIEEGKQTISTVDSSELKSANLKHELPPSSGESEEETLLPDDPSLLPGPDSHFHMCDGMLQEVDTSNETLSAAAVEAPEVVDN